MRGEAQRDTGGTEGRYRFQEPQDNSAYACSEKRNMGMREQGGEGHSRCKRTAVALLFRAICATRHDGEATNNHLRRPVVEVEDSGRRRDTRARSPFACYSWFRRCSGRRFKATKTWSASVKIQRQKKGCR